MGGQYGSGSHFSGSPTGHGAGASVTSGGGTTPTTSASSSAVSAPAGTLSATSAESGLRSAAVVPVGYSATSDKFSIGLRPTGYSGGATGQFVPGALSATVASTGQVVSTGQGYQADIQARQAYEGMD